MAFDVLGIRRPVDGTPVDRRAEIERDGNTELTVRQGYPDLVLVHRALGRRRGRRRGIVITVEAQKAYDRDKRWLIPVYQANLAEEHRLDTYAVVVSLDPQMSRALRAWSRAGPPKLDVLLIDVQTVPISPWLDDPARRPTAAVLAGALHGYAGNFEAARRAFLFTQTMSGKRRRRHGMTILAALPEHQRNQLIGELPVQEQHDWMDVERRSGTYAFGRREGREEGREEGRKEALEQAREALLTVIFDLLAERGVTVNARSKARIRRCEDLPTLQRWVKQAVRATSVRELV